VEAVEAVARDAGCSRIEATTALPRTGAHRFYDGAGLRPNVGALPQAALGLLLVDAPIMRTAEPRLAARNRTRAKKSG
jgi:hypothetical protein